MTNQTIAIPTVALNDGNHMPQLGFGVFQIPDGEAADAVSAALEAGYRSIDTAALYGNERGVGQALAASGLPRDELFVTTKVWNSDQGYDRTLRAFDTSMAKLGLDYLDLYLIHWPAPARASYPDTWRALERLRADGRVRSIGVSNFHAEHLRRLAEESDTVPAVNQIELHPFLQQQSLRAENAARGIVTEAWSPLAKGGELLGDNTVVALARKHDQTPAQVVLRWHLQLGNVVIPKSATPDRIRRNLDVFGFTLDDDDLARMSTMERGLRTGPDPDRFEA